MFKRPTTRRTSKNEGVTLNLVPILDTMVALISFLLFTMSFLSIVSVETPFPEASPQDVEQKLKEKPLQLTLTIREGEVEIWSPFERVPSKKIPDPTPGQPDLKAIHTTLMEIKKNFPTETKLVVVPNPAVNYDVLVAVMDASRVLEPSDEPIYFKNPKTDRNEIAKALFPEIIFGNLLGDA